MTQSLTVQAAIAAYNADPNMAPVSVGDSAGAVGANISTLEPIAEHGKITSVVLTYGGPPVNSPPLETIYPQILLYPDVLQLIQGPYALRIHGGLNKTV